MESTGTAEAYRNQVDAAVMRCCGERYSTFVDACPSLDLGRDGRSRVAVASERQVEPERFASSLAKAFGFRTVGSVSPGTDVAWENRCQAALIQFSVSLSAKGQQNSLAEDGSVVFDSRFGETVARVAPDRAGRPGFELSVDGNVVAHRIDLGDAIRDMAANLSRNTRVAALGEAAEENEAVEVKAPGMG